MAYSLLWNWILLLRSESRPLAQPVNSRKEKSSKYDNYLERQIGLVYNLLLKLNSTSPLRKPFICISDIMKLGGEVIQECYCVWLFQNYIISKGKSEWFTARFEIEFHFFTQQANVHRLGRSSRGEVRQLCVSDLHKANPNGSHSSSNFQIHFFGRKSERSKTRSRCVSKGEKSNKLVINSFSMLICCSVYIDFCFHKANQNE